MPLTRTATITQITVLEDRQILIRNTIRAFDDDGSLIGERHIREVLEPGDSLALQPNHLKQLAQIYWSAQVIADYKANKNAHLIR